MQASVNVAEATLKQAQWELTQTVITAPVDGWVTNLSARVGNYATTGQPVFALVDSHSFYVVGYFEETKLRHIREGSPAAITLYSGSQKLQGHVSSIGRAIYDQSVETDSGLVPDIKPNVPGCVWPSAFRFAWSLTVYRRTLPLCPAPPALSPSATGDEAAESLLAKHAVDESDASPVALRAA